MSLMSPINDKLAPGQEKVYTQWANVQVQQHRRAVSRVLRYRKGRANPSNKPALYASSPLKQHRPQERRKDSVLHYFQGHLLLKRAKKSVKYNSYYWTVAKKKGEFKEQSSISHPAPGSLYVRLKTTLSHVKMVT